MKKHWISGVALVAVVGVFILVVTTNETKDKRESATKNSRNTAYPKYTEKGAPDSSIVNASADSMQSIVEEERAYDAEVLSAPVRALLGLDGEARNYNSMSRAIHQLSKELELDDVEALLEMLTWSNERFPEGMRPIEINAVKNDVLDRLLRQNVLPEGIGLQLVEMASNSENDPVWRDYCVQFMAPYYERALGELNLTTEGTEAHRGRASNTFVSSSEAGGEKIDELDAVREAMVAALDERGTTIAGTSLIGLELLSRTHDEFDRDVIVGKASEIAADESASAASRMTAMRLSAQISNNEQGISNIEVAESARLIAQTGETVLLRSAAIVTLGETGSEADRELLESYTLDENRQIAHAATLALAKMDTGPSQSVELDVVEQVSSQPKAQEKLPPILIN